MNKATAADLPESLLEAPAAASWQNVVADKVKTLRFGVVQIIVHDSKVVQIERTERTRFDIPRPS